MKFSYKVNIERGLAEIVRKKNLTIAIFFSSVLPYGLLVCWPLSEYLDRSLRPILITMIPTLVYSLFEFIIIVGPLICLFKVLLRWNSKSLCPNCGMEVGYSPYPFTIKNWKCKSCNLEIIPPPWFNDKITFKRINYMPGFNKHKHFG